MRVPSLSSYIPVNCFHTIREYGILTLSNHDHPPSSLAKDGTLQARIYHGCHDSGVAGWCGGTVNRAIQYSGALTIVQGHCSRTSIPCSHSIHPSCSLPRTKNLGYSKPCRVPKPLVARPWFFTVKCEPSPVHMSMQPRQFVFDCFAFVLLLARQILKRNPEERQGPLDSKDRECRSEFIVQVPSTYLLFPPGCRAHQQSSVTRL